MRGDLVNQVMYGIVGKSEKDRFVFMQEVDRFLSEDLGQVGIIIALRFELLISTVSHQRTEGSCVLWGQAFFPVYLSTTGNSRIHGRKTRGTHRTRDSAGRRKRLGGARFCFQNHFYRSWPSCSRFPEDTCQSWNAFGQSW